MDTGAMRRWLTLLLLVILPLQFSYAVAASYCQHESGTHAGHFGHHVHVHQDGDHEGHDGKGKPKSKLLIDNDCTGCHWSKPELLPDALEVPALPAASAPHASDLAPYSSVDPHRIERPNWLQPL